MKIVLVGFLPDCHGCSCDTHPYGCRNAFIESVGNGVGRFVCLRLVDTTNLAVHKVQEGGPMAVAFVSRRGNTPVVHMHTMEGESYAARKMRH